ncbi:MAG: transposase [Nitrososphaerota archaeon]|jgi:hypothetical protein|nr:transposase [Nitrososphaerota archaeon]
MLKLYLWGYFNGIRSSRKLENECHRNLETMWLIKRITPDFKTIADFRKDNVDPVKSVFNEFNSFLNGLGMFTSHEVAIDGTKVKAVNSMDRSYTAEFLKNTIEKVGQRIEKYLKEMDENDASEKREIDRSRVPEVVKKLKEKKAKLEGIKDKMDKSGMSEISLTDPEARQMKTRHGIDVCYNGHISVEAGNHLIVDYSVDNSTNDYWSVVPLARGSKGLLGYVDVSADKGHFSLQNLEDLASLGIPAYIPSAMRGNPDKKTGVPERKYRKDKFIYDPDSDTYTCPQGSELQVHMA